MKCVICGGAVVLRESCEVPRKTDASYSLAREGWVCFGCQCEPVEAFDDKTDPNMELDWQAFL